MKTVAFVSGTGGTGKTSLVYHLAHMLSRLAYPTLAVDLDPLAALSSLFLGEEALDETWDEGRHTVLSSAAPLFEGRGDIQEPNPFQIAESLWGLAAEPALWTLEGELAVAHSDCYTGDSLAASQISVVHQIVSRAVTQTKSEVVLLDVGSGLGSLQRAALLAADFLIFPLVADTFSLHGLKVLGPFVSAWREEWRGLRMRITAPPVDLPEGKMEPMGYVVLRLNQSPARRTHHQTHWMNQLPTVYASKVLGAEPAESSVDEDPNCLEVLRNYYGLTSLALNARKPMFDLGPADGAMGTYRELVDDSYVRFEALAKSIAARCGLRKSAQ